MGINLSELGFDEKQLEQDLIDILKDGFETIFEGAKDDYTNYMKAIAGELVKALRAGDKEATGELKAQLKLIAEANRIRVVGEQWVIAEKLMTMILGFGSKMIIYLAVARQAEFKRFLGLA